MPGTQFSILVAIIALIFMIIFFQITLLRYYLSLLLQESQASEKFFPLKRGVSLCGLGQGSLDSWFLTAVEGLQFQSHYLGV